VPIQFDWLILQRFVHGDKYGVYGCRSISIYS
jgi:hypothetical protein